MERLGGGFAVDTCCDFETFVVGDGSGGVFAFSFHSSSSLSMRQATAFLQTFSSPSAASAVLTAKQTPLPGGRHSRTAVSSSGGGASCVAGSASSAKLTRSPGSQSCGRRGGRASANSRACVA